MFYAFTRSHSMHYTRLIIHSFTAGCRSSLKKNRLRFGVPKKKTRGPIVMMARTELQKMENVTQYEN